ncbi:periplasmic binding protein-like II [Vararia minispora EC-137]|uniref:Periplasmic binding protein-like II n=1 Tax=Vararia minispora EC-137 TaxID=1314806 RepID=A0ACB8QVD2_9AGAM|nr:periplasmic binding protein-like II [Vararia minispora EC-137]
MSLLRVGYVREHFSSPLLQYAHDDQEKTFRLVECPGGTGQLISRLTSNEIDVAMQVYHIFDLLLRALTDPLISGIANGSQSYRLVGSYVSTPLNWAVITGASSPYKSIADLKGTKIGISRPGSGSQTMAYVMALNEHWSPDALQFQVNNDIRGLIDSVNEESTAAFMWEWFTTKPWADKGEVRFIGSVPTPWPSWMIAAHPSPTRAPSDALRTFLHALSSYVTKFDAPEARETADVEFIKATFGYPEEDVKAWLKTVGYPSDCTIVSAEVIQDTLAVLSKAGVVKAATYDVKDFVDTQVASLA